MQLAAFVSPVAVAAKFVRRRTPVSVTDHIVSHFNGPPPGPTLEASFLCLDCTSLLRPPALGPVFSYPAAVRLSLI